MKKITRLAFLLCMVFCLASCGFTKYSALPSPMNSNNFEYVRDVEADVSFTYILGIGGLTDKDIYEKLIDKAELKAGEALVNVTSRDVTKYYLGIVMINDIHASGQVVRYTDNK